MDQLDSFRSQPQLLSMSTTSLCLCPSLAVRVRLRWSRAACDLRLSDRAGHPSTPSVAGQDGEENPATLAENCFRELLGRAAYGNMNNAVRPVLV